MVADEQRAIEPPPSTASVIPPWMTAQVEACNDFAPPVADSHLTVCKTESRPGSVLQGDGV